MSDEQRVSQYSTYREGPRVIHVTCDGADVHCCGDQYEADMFIAELRARLKAVPKVNTLRKGELSVDEKLEIAVEALRYLVGARVVNAYVARDALARIL